MNPFPRDRIGMRLLAFFVVASIILSIPIITVQFYYEYAREKDEIVERVELIEASTIPALRHALWIGDQAHVHSLAIGISNLPMVQRVIIRDGEGVMLADEGGFTDIEVSPLSYSITQKYRDRRVFLANLDIYINRSAATEDVVGRMGFVFFAEMAKLALIAAVLLFIVRFMITRQLTVMAEYAGRIRPDRLEEELKLDRMPLCRGRADELATLEAAINQMRLSLSAEMKQAKRQAATIAELERNRRAILEAAGEGIVGVDIKGSITFLNPAAAQMIGVDPLNVLGMDFYQIRENHIDARHQTSIMRAMSERRQIRAVQGWKLIGRDHVRTYSFVASPVYEDDAVIGCVVVFTDITEQVEMQDELRRLNRELEVRVAEETDRCRTGERLLFQQSKFAAMGQMLTAFSHQWRQPLNVIALLVQDLEEAFDAGELDAEYVDQMVKRTMRQVMLMSDAVDDFRAFHETSRTATGFDVRESILGALKLAHSLLNYAGITPTLMVGGVACRLDSTLTPANDVDLPNVPLFGYRSELTHVVLALVIAARDAVVARHAVFEDGMVENGVIGLAVDQDEGHVRIIITHNGVNPELGSKVLFDPAKELESGMGALGISTARAVLESRLMGRLDVIDSGGIETTSAFIITIPRTVSTEAVLGAEED